MVVVWAIRRSAPARRDPSEQALRDRPARGEIDQAEFLVRMRALDDGHDKGNHLIAGAPYRGGSRGTLPARRLQSADPIRNQPAASARPAPRRDAAST